MKSSERHPYTELRTHSAFSFLQAASLPEELIERAAMLGYSAVALGDRDGVYGAPRFHQAAKQAGVRAIVGCEISLRLEEVVGLSNLTTNNLTTCSLYLLAATRTGYQNLCKLLTRTKLRAAKGQASATWEDLEGHSDGLICLAGGMDGLLARVVRLLGCYVVRPEPADALNQPTTENQQPNRLTTDNLGQLIARLHSLFPNRLYIDIQRHFDPDEERRNRVLIDIARHFRIPLVATNGVRHATPDGRRLLDVLTCIRHKTSLDAAGRLLARNAERHLKAPAEMAALFRDLPEAVANTRRIAEQCEFTLADLGYRFPDYPLPPGETPIGHLRQLTYAGAHERYGRLSDKVRRQLEHELHIIGKLDLAGYFLIVWDIVRFCRENHILAQGRGSAANSAVCYALGITAVDAVGMELLFERFLSEERGEWPDIDIDLPSGEQRERVIQYVYQRYNERGATGASAAMTANVITYRTRSAVREVGKALGFSMEQVGKLSKLLNRFEFRDGSDELGKQLKAGGVDPGAPRVGLLVDLVQRIQNLPRHLGQHSGGMIIAAGRLDTVVPLEPAAMPGRVVVQWDKEDCADLGIIKVDLLGLGMMAVLEEAIPLIRVHEGVDIDLARLPPDDPQTYAMLQRADTIGVFQVESRAQMATLPRMRPEKFYDLVVEVAMIRPGPIVGQMVHPYLNRRAGREPVTYAHPSLEPILRRTLGVPMFQEQLLRMAMVVAGFTGGEAEELRRAMGFKRSTERMRQIEARLRAGMAERGIAGDVQDEIVRSITSFALYGFPESHAASFALLAYASAYLRAHHLAAFTCALLNHWPMGFYHPATLVKDAQRHGVRVLPVDVVKSSWDCSLEDVVTSLGCYVVKEEGASPLEPAPSHQPPNTPTTNNLRLGFRYVAGLREATGRRIENERLAAAFTSVADVIRRCELRDDEAQTLAHLGAFSVFGATRREALWQVSAMQREPLLVAIRPNCVKYFMPIESDEHCPPGNEDEGVSESIVSGPSGLASVDESGQASLHPGAGVAAFGAIRFEQSDSAGGQFDPGQHRRGQRPIDTKGFRSLPADSARKSAGAGNPHHAERGSGVDQSRKNPSASGTDRIRGQATQSPDPFSRAPNTNNLTTNNLTTNNLTTNNLRTNNLRTNNLTPCPLPDLSPLDRTLADYANSGLTVGPHIVAHVRELLQAQGVVRASDLPRVKNGRWTKIAGLVIVRQRPGTAKGFCFITLEDETGTANAVVVPDIFQRFRSVIHTAALLIIEGPLQKVVTEKEVVGLLGCDAVRQENPTTNNLTTNNLTSNNLASAPPTPVIHIRAKRITELHLPQQAVTLTGHGYRMRVTPADQPQPNNQQPNNEQPNNEQPNNEQPVSLPKSHDFR